MGCGCLNKNKVEIISKIERPNCDLDNNIISNHSKQNSREQNILISNNNNHENNIHPPPVSRVNNEIQNNEQINNNEIIDREQNEDNNLWNLQNIINSSEEGNFEPNYEPYLQSKHDENFNYKEVDKEYVGEGVKKMKGYICPVSYEELQKIREEFWTSRIEGNAEIWEILHTICNDKNLTKEDINIYMKSSKIRTYKGCINVTYDSKGYLYEIPNYCINDPLIFEKKDEEEVIKNIPNKEDIQIRVRCFSNEIKIKICNLSKIEELKNIIRNNKSFNDKYDLNNLRLFYGGKELQNDKQIWFYHIENKSIIQMLAQINTKENNENNNKIRIKIDKISGDNRSENNSKDDIENEFLGETCTEKNKLLLLSKK